MTQSTAQKRKGFWLFNYFGEIINELKKVVWLKWPQEVLYLTGMVLLVTIISGIILGSLDFGFSALVNKVFMGG
jgi:preprotein translocase SecE subunit